ncbi:MAG: L,D-transpeptidase family protein [Rhodobacteraceae bacterium]|nr:L,D-transpeptidase family protein [Paracoccaceae bacterium]
MYHFSNSSSLRNIFFAITITALGATAPVFAQETATETVIELTSEERFAATLQGIFADGGRDLADFANFYAARDNQPIWAGGNSKTMLALITAIEQAPNHGMALGRYNLVELEALWMAGNTPEDMAALEAAAAQSYVLFATEISSGILDPTSIHEEMNSTRHVPEIADVLSGISTATNMTAHYQTLPPSSAGYAQLLDLKKELEALISSEGWGPLVPTGRTLRPGNTSDRVPALRVRLDQRGYDLDDLTSHTYGDDIIAAVKLFQTDFGLNSDGLVGPQTLSSINAQPDGRLKQVIVNLERIRWMNYELGSRHIYVNIPDFTASVMDYGVPTLSFRVVVGTGKNQTAEFSDTMTHMIANPTWNVPYSIASEEYLPKLRADPTVLARENILMTVRGSGQLVDPNAIDFSYFDEDNFPFFLQQQAGGGNALGRVKFMFPNRFNIYLHDTPSKSLFSRDARAFSHGCVRVQKPMEFAYTLLSLQEDNPEAVFNRALNSGEETQIDLASPVPVHIVYRTVWIDDAGEVQYRHDVYGRDTLVFDALVNVGVTLPALDS